VAGHAAELRGMNAAPHVAQNATGRASAVDGRATRHPGHAVGRRVRRRVAAASGRTEAPGGPRRTRCRGLGRVGRSFTFAAAAYGLVRLPRPLEA
jgi:hypothetical protein